MEPTCLFSKRLCFSTLLSTILSSTILNNNLLINNPLNNNPLNNNNFDPPYDYVGFNTATISLHEHSLEKY
ncbi:unnamed protein product [Arabis nemorensis]|uniref:Legume lectin domain-containing protein n=1 Tax=Arabis nemorensis TaxID=586526 RepID=A0A565BNE4_9BRAS|nr:unnamed protein product [Arabis nemorensis]